MSGRRRYNRFAVAQPWEGRLRILRDVTIRDGGDDRGLEIMSPVPGVPGEVVALDLAGAGTLVTLVICVTESRPAIVDGAVRHLLRAVVIDETRRVERRTDEGQSEPATRGEVLAAADVVGVLVRELDVHVRNVSASGCLVETQSAIGEGTTAALRLRAAGEELNDAVRVMRCDRLAGAGARYLVGVEYLWASAPSPGSLRRAVRRLEREVTRSAEAVEVSPPLVM